MISSSKKIKISALVIFTAIIGSVFIFDLNKIGAQGFQSGEVETYHNGVRSDLPQGGIISSTPLDDPFARTDRNVQATQEQAQNLQGLQQQDMQKCMAEGSSSLRGPMNGAIQEGLGQAIDNTLSQNLPSAMEEQIKNKLPDELSSATIEIFPTKLKEKVQLDLNVSMEGILSEAEADAGRPLSGEERSQIFKTELLSSVQNNFADAFKDSIKESFPIAIENSIRKGLPEAVTSVFENNLPGQISEQIPNAMQQQLQPLVLDLLIDQIAGVNGGFDPASLIPLIPGILEGLGEGVADIIEGIGDLFGLESDDDEENDYSNATSVTPEMMGDITEAMMDEYSEIAITNLQENMDEIINQANLALDDSMDEILSSIEDELDGVIDETLDELTGALEGELDQVLDSLTGPLEGVIDDTLGQLNGVFDDLTGVFDGVTNQLTGVINQSMGTFTNTLTTAMGTITDSITAPITGAIDGVIDGVLSPVTGAISSVTDSITGAITEPISNITNNLTENILDPVTGAFDNVVGGVTEGITGAAGDIASNALTNAGVPDVIAGPVGDAVTNVTAGVVSNIPGLSALGGIAGIGVYVPVRETSGPLLSATESIDTTNASIDQTTQRIEQLTIEICTQLKSIKRIQTAFEQKEFVEDVDLRRQANEASELYRNELIDFSKRGYDSTGEGPDAPLYVENPIKHVDELVKPEATKVYFDDLQKSSNSFKDDTANKLVQDLSKPANYSSVSLDQYNKFGAGEINDSQEWFSTFIAMKNPFEANTPETSYKLNAQALAQAQDRAEADFYEQLSAGNGYLPVRECVEYTANNSACRRWKVVTPASQVQDVTAEALNYRLDLYKNADPGDVSPGGGPSLEETRTNTPSNGGGGGGNPGGGIGDIINMLQELLTGILNGGDDEESGGQLEVSFTKTVPTATEINTGTNRVARLNWSAPLATSCVANSDWISGSNPNLSSPLILTAEKGESLAISGQKTISLPIQFNVRIIRERDEEETLIATSFADHHLAQSQTITLTNDILDSEDSVIIRFWPYTEDYEVKVNVTESDTPTTVINKLQTAITTAQNDTTPANSIRTSMFNKFIFTPNSPAGKINIKAKLSYKIRCTDGSNTVEKTINLN